jgi:hypothetical protein
MSSEAVIGLAPDLISSLRSSDNGHLGSLIAIHPWKDNYIGITYRLR